MQKKINPLESFRLSSGSSVILQWLGDKGADSIWLDYEIPKSQRTKKIFSSNISRLKKGDLIKKENNKITFTDKGRLAYLKLKIKEGGLLPKKEVCIVVFDVPEKERYLRKSIRNFLNSIGFFPIQKSVWLSKFDSTKKLNEYFCLVGLDDRILALTAKKE